MNQKDIEKLNKQIFETITKNVSKEEFIDFYIHHNRADTCKQYGIRNNKQLSKILCAFNYNFSAQKPSLYKGKASARSHDSYVSAGKKSSETQKAAWKAKTKEELEQWSIKQSKAHMSATFREKVIANNKAYRAGLTQDELDRQNGLRKQSMKNWWESLSGAEKESVMQNRFKNGRSYHQKNSEPNRSFAELLENKGISFEREFCLDRKFFDFKIGDTLVEIDPTFTHNSTFNPFNHGEVIDKRYHQLKSDIAKKYGYKCVHVFDWDDCSKIINLLENKQMIVYGRNCEVREVEQSECDMFLNEFHLQGSARASIRIGLYNKSSLVSVMTFGKPRYNKNYEYELIRYCSKLKVIGGAEKLFKYFTTKYSPRSIVSYCDLSKFTGSTYNKLNFTLLRNPSPSKHWYNVKTKEHYTDSLLRQQGFSRIINHKDAKDDTDLLTSDNRQLMIDAGFVEVYDCGQATYGWTEQKFNSK